MHVLIAFDKFKDCLTAPEACALAASTLREQHPDWTLDLCPLTDGGEGFCEILTRAAGGTLEKYPVTGPRGTLVEAPIGLVPIGKIPPPARRLLAIENRDSKIENGDDRIAIIAMASASGLALLPENLRDPWQTTSFGTGELLRHAARRGATALLLGLGGSATHDLGLGALQALGLAFHSATGATVTPPCPARWSETTRISGEISPALPPLHLACDVTNPLLGRTGAATVFAPQKGLRPADLARLECASARLAALLTTHSAQPASLAEVPGAGAAGGLAFGLMTAARAQRLSGFDLVNAWLDLDARLAAADVVLTGEGRFDASSLGGKAPGALAARAAALGKPAHLFAGSLSLPAPSPRGWFPHTITPAGTPLAEALRDAPAHLAAAVRAAF